MPIDLGSGVTVQVEPPTTPTTVVVPIGGPPGEQGPQGPAGPAGPPGGAYQHTQTSPALLVQIIHGLSYSPAGIVCIETDGVVLEYDTVTHPASGITEVAFGVPFVGVIYLS